MGESFFEQFLVILGCSVIATTLFRRIQLPPLLAYLSVGVFIGPHAIALLKDIDSLHLLTEMGVVFLLFMLGLEFSLSRMIAMRNTVFGLGGFQVILTSVVLIAISLFLDLSLSTAIVLAGALSLSSTAIVSRELIQRNELDTAHGKHTIGILIFQDLAAVFFLIMVPALAGERHAGSDIALMLMEGMTLLIILLLVGRIIMPMLFHESARSGSSDTFLLTTLFTVMLAAWITHEAGLSMALGGFMAGMMLGGSRYRFQLEADIRPFRDLLLGLFFITVGAQLNLQVLLNNWYWILLLTTALIVVKTLIISGLTVMLTKDPANSVRVGLSLSQGGEFGFALLALALGTNLINDEIGSIATTTIIISMIVTPFLINHSGRFTVLLEQKRKLKVEQEPELSTVPHQHKNHVIICGFGRVGQTIVRFLQPHNIPYVVIEKDPVRVSEARLAGENISYGDASRADILTALGADKARMLILTLPDQQHTLNVIKRIRPHFENLPILVKTQDDSLLTELQNAGATEVIPEELEGSLMLVSHILSLLEVDHRKIEQQISNTRSERYHLLHGYYHGQFSHNVTRTGQLKEILHPVSITTGSFSCDHELQQLNLDRLKITIPIIRRGNHSIEEPSGKTIIHEGDIIILQGTAHRIEKAESILLVGR